MLNYLLPVLIAFQGGKLIGGDRGGVMGAIATIGVIVGAPDYPMLMGAMVMGPFKVASCAFGSHPFSINNAVMKPHAMNAPIFGITIELRNLPKRCTAFFMLLISSLFCHFVLYNRDIENKGSAKKHSVNIPRPEAKRCTAFFMLHISSLFCPSPLA